MTKERKFLVILFNPELPEEEAFQSLKRLGSNVFQNPVNSIITDAVSALVMSGEKIGTPIQIYEMSFERIEKDKRQEYKNYIEELQTILQRYKQFVRYVCPYAKNYFCETCAWLLREHIRELTRELIISSRGRYREKYQAGES